MWKGDDVATIDITGGGSEDKPGGETPRACLEFTDEERREAWNLSAFDTATRQDRPVALWIIGPSAVGKSTLANELAPELGIPLLRPGTGRPSILASSSDTKSVLDAVIVDGHFFREVHSTYKIWSKSADWASAYPALKPLINKEKQELTKRAADERKHLVIPQTCLNLSKCLSEVQELVTCGYTNQVLAIFAPREEVARRGHAREQATGKRYAPSEYEHSMAAIGPMIAACNGEYRLVRSIEQVSPPASEMLVRQLSSEVLARGLCGSEPTLPTEVLAS